MIEPPCRFIFMEMLLIWDFGTILVVIKLHCVLFSQYSFIQIEKRRDAICISRCECVNDGL